MTQSPPAEPLDQGPGRQAERAARTEAARAALVPLGEHERPPALSAAVLLAVVVAVAVAVGTATIKDLSGHHGSLLGGSFLTLFLLALAVGMYRRRYWAVVAFEALLVFQILTATWALVLVNSYAAALGWVAAIALGGILFWKLIRVMGRMQAGQIRAD